MPFRTRLTLLRRLTIHGYELLTKWYDPPSTLPLKLTGNALQKAMMVGADETIFLLGFQVSFSGAFGYAL